MDPNLTPQPTPIPPQPITPIQMPPVEPPVPSQQPASALPKKPRPVIPLLLVFLFIILAGAGGFITYQKFVTPKTPEPTPTATASPAPTLDWLTYENATHRFSLKYPKSWTIDQNGDNEKINAKVKFQKSYAIIQIYANMDGIGGQGRDYAGTPIIISGMDLFRYQADNSYNNTQTIGITESLTNSLGLFRVNGKTFSITLSYPIEDSEQEGILKIKEEFNLILSTIKFTDQEDETVNWKEYEIKILGLTFKAPSEMNIQINEGDSLTVLTLYIQNYPFNAPPPDPYYQLYSVYNQSNLAEADISGLKKDLTGSSETAIAGRKMIQGQIKGERNRYVSYILLDKGYLSLFTAQAIPENKAMTEKILATFVFSE